MNGEEHVSNWHILALDYLVREFDNFKINSVAILSDRWKAEYKQ